MSKLSKNVPVKFIPFIVMYLVPYKRTEANSRRTMNRLMKKYSMQTSCNSEILEFDENSFDYFVVHTYS